MSSKFNKGKTTSSSSQASFVTLLWEGAETIRQRIEQAKLYVFNLCYISFPFHFLFAFKFHSSNEQILAWMRHTADTQQHQADGYKSLSISDLQEGGYAFSFEVSFFGSSISFLAQFRMRGNHSLL